jgi:glycosyltransferase involved in cell wall biosynthesis
MNGIETIADASADTANSPALVTVVVGAFNHERYVVECLDSIVRGTYPNLELVIVDDASVDATKQIVRDWIRDHPQFRTTFLDHTKNLGLSASLNEAIGHAGGEYFCLIAADDVMLPNGVTDRVECLLRQPDKLAVFGDTQVIDETGKLLYESVIEGYFWDHGMRKDALEVDALMPYNIVFHWAVPGPAFMCRMSTFATIGLYDEECIAEDYDVYLRLAARGKLGFCNAYVAQYRKHTGSMTATYFDELQDYLSEAARKNMPAFGIICKLRLCSSWVHLVAERTPTRRRKQLLTILHKLLLLVSWRSYRVKRYLILRSHRSTSRDPTC